MSKKEYYLLLDALLELDPNTIKGDESLSEIKKWDSLAIMGFIALLDQHFALRFPAARIIGCRTIADLVALTGDKII